MLSVGTNGPGDTDEVGKGVLRQSSHEICLKNKSKIE